MSLKGVELQIAIPKTFDAGKIADQHQQNTIHQQLHANEALKKEIERKQFLVNDTEDMEGITEEEHQGSASEESMLSSKKEQEQENEKEKIKHPFKGNFIDFSG